MRSSAILASLCGGAFVVAFAIATYAGPEMRQPDMREMRQFRLRDVSDERLRELYKVAVARAEKDRMPPKNTKSPRARSSTPIFRNVRNRWMTPRSRRGTQRAATFFL